MNPSDFVADPLGFADVVWPHVEFYSKQQEIINSVRDNDETFVPAGNELGKDFVSAFIVLWFFLTRHPCRIITTSADYSQLEGVLWGEIRNFISSAAVPLDSLVVNHMHLRKKVDKIDQLTGMPVIDRNSRKPVMEMCGLSYVMARVAAKGEGMLGHHIADVGDGIPRTLFIADEASGVDDVSYDRSDTWATRKLIIGNCYGAGGFFKDAVKGGDILAKRRSALKR